MVESYHRLYAGAYASSDYVKAVRGMIDTLQQRYDVRRRRDRSEESSPQEGEGQEREETSEKAAHEQAAFTWEELTPSRRARSGRRRT
jgi:hypothetical protein